MGLWSTYLVIELVSFEACGFYQSEVNILCEKEMGKKYIANRKGLTEKFK